MRKSRRKHASLMTFNKIEKILEEKKEKCEVKVACKMAWALQNIQQLDT